MSTAFRRTTRITRRTLGYGFLVLLIVAALLVSVANLFLPYIENNPEKIQVWLTERVGQPVSFHSSKTIWTKRGPKITLTGLTVGKEKSLVRIGQAELLVAVYSGLLPNHPLTELKVKGLFLRLEQQDDDRWVLLGLPKQENSDEDALDVLSGFGELQIGSSVLLVTPKNKQTIRIPRVDLRLRVKGDTLSIGMQAEAVRGDTPLTLVAKVDRKNITGQIWLGGKNLHIKNWVGLFPSLKTPKTNSNSELNIWADIDQRRIMRVHSRLKIDDLRYDLPKKNIFDFTKHTIYKSIEAESIWQRSETGWNWYIPKIRFVSERGEEVVNDIRVHADQDDWIGQADSIALNPATVLMPLLKGQLPDITSWSQKAQIAGNLSNLKANGTLSLKNWTVSGQGLRLGFNPIDNAPGLHDFSGVFAIDNKGGTFRFINSKPQLDWPISFGDSIPSTLDGALIWWKSGSDWVLAARDLHWAGEGIDIALDSQIQFYNSGKAPMLNLAADLKTFDFNTAKRFWLRHIMNESTINWLDMALVKGQVRDASIVLSGDLDHWPFTDKTGRFSARTVLFAEQFKFASDWPAAQNTLLNVDFNGPGFTASGSTTYLNNPINLQPSGIESFSASDLVINVSATSNMQTLLPVLNETPLKATVGDLVANLKGSGAVETNVKLLLPLSKGAEFNRTQGSIAFNGTDIQSKDLNLAMSQVKGLAKFDNDGFSASDLKANMDKNPVRFGIRVGDKHVKNNVNHIEADLKGDFNTEYLLKFDPSLSDLSDVLKGKSPWLFLVNVPVTKNTATAPVYLRAQSNLVGTVLNLPVPLYKSALESKTFELNTQLPADKSPIEFKIGSDFRLLLNAPVGKPMSGIALFGNNTQGSIPASGFSVRGDVDEFDVPAWISLAGKAAGDGGLQSFDLLVKHLRLIGSDFGTTRLLLRPNPNAFVMRASGDNIDGTVTMPNAKNSTITGQFSKLYFKKTITAPVVPVNNSEKTDTALKASDIPAIQFTIDDLRIANIPMGRTELATSPTPVGMKIQKFNSKSALISTSVSGLWQGEGKQERVAFKAHINSPDLGELLSIMQYADMIKQGELKADIDIFWSGGLTDFNLQTISGVLDLDIKEGQILHVEPGGSGRVLGLFSLAEIPRRLSLNFSDFFGKGFAFKKINGHFNFAQGKATTDNLLITAPAADIKISGSTDYATQQYNQIVEVYPKTSGILPVIGALAAGPIGIAAGVVAQVMLKKPINETSETAYSITGPWSEPEVKKIDSSSNNEKE
jgi:uncharacterized protein (TIGR02099 family)